MNMEIFHEMAMKAKDGKPIINVCLDEIESLRKQRSTNFVVVDQIVRQQGEIESLREQLAAALAAIKLKDAFIEKVAKQMPEKPDYWSSCSQFGYNSSEAEDLLAIQPDDSALMAWLGEPVGYISDHLRYVLERSTPYIPMSIEMSLVNFNWPNQMPLCAPKGVTK